ncbi:hypothetical protein [Gracilimonas mengyeensis]|uniref:Uncharacterized protein n=1 Tax=Gracilimonas mengyeensis TaxID=1302730 RepID=A0A521EHR6_9BACT|nr:hypothetical protein [Gracilimonas mengyeensis]SMO83011.1 hypothetical protein SAMN06265219_11221 [Gracilimonas mengyeensis]
MKNILNLILLTFIAFLFTQCLGGINDREDCDGYPKLINPIPDTTVALSQDTLFIDLSGSNDSVFRHTAGKGMIFSFGGTARITQRYKNRNPELGKEALVILEETGTFEGTIIATDDCEKLERDDFKLTITN